MARGWESKSVEAQQADREQTPTAIGPVSPEAGARAVRRRTLEMARARAVADLAAAKSAAHRAMLDAAITVLDEQRAAAADAPRPASAR
jgi:hypothetical protein